MAIRPLTKKLDAAEKDFFAASSSSYRARDAWWEAGDERKPANQIQWQYNEYVESLSKVVSSARRAKVLSALTLNFGKFRDYREGQAHFAELLSNSRRAKILSSEEQGINALLSSGSSLSPEEAERLTKGRTLSHEEQGLVALLRSRHKPSK